MVSSGQVNSDSNSLETLLTNYDSTINGVSSAWKGDSYNNLKAKAGAFVSEYKSISSQMSSFANACDLYAQYKQIKENDDIARKNFDTAQAAGDLENANKFYQEVEGYYNQLTSLIAQIQNELNSVCSVKLEASEQEYSVSSVNVKGEFKNFYQYDYGNVSYGYGTSIASSGCGPTSMAMVLTYLTGNEVTPPETAQWSLNHGYRVQGKGTAWAYFDAISNAYGINCQQQNVSSANITTSLQNGQPVIMSVGPGTFTKGGHFIVLTGIDSNGNITVADPASEQRSHQSYPISTFLNEGRQMWSFS